MPASLVRYLSFEAPHSPSVPLAVYVVSIFLEHRFCFRWSHCVRGCSILPFTNIFPPLRIYHPVPLFGPVLLGCHTRDFFSLALVLQVSLLVDGFGRCIISVFTFSFVRRHYVCIYVPWLVVMRAARVGGAGLTSGCKFHPFFISTDSTPSRSDGGGQGQF